MLTGKNSLALFVVLIGLYAAQVFYLKILNKKHSSARERLGKPAFIKDVSMSRVKARADAADEGQEEDVIGHHAFDDKTDWENEDFIFVY
jgi:hypothetical protein